MTNLRTTYIDLFCGCGGLSLGARLAGFTPIAAIDKDPKLSAAYSSNFPDSKVINADVSDISSEQLSELTENNRLGGLIGGPPCQGFSLMGRRNANDPRNKLLIRFYELVQEFRPKFFLMENVPGLLQGRGKLLLDQGIELVAKHYNMAPLTSFEPIFT